jgi:hypothetical protein
VTRPIVRRVKGDRYPDTLFPVWRYRHLHKVFGKLGISSRKELRAARSDAGTVVLE